MRLFSAVAVFFILSSAAFSQGSSDDPNLLMGEAIDIYERGAAASGNERIELLSEVDAILDRIETEYPDSIPANFMKTGTPLGPIDRDGLKAELQSPAQGLPKATMEAITRIATQACETTGCVDTVSSELAETILKIGFTDTAQAVADERLKWLFSNPGQLTGDLERVQVFESMLDDPGFLEKIDGRVVDSLAKDVAADLAKDISISLVTNVVTEVTASWLEDQGREREAALARIWIEPTVDIVKTVAESSAATGASAGASAVIIWAKNAVAFVELGQKTLDSEAAIGTKDEQLVKVASDISSLQTSLITGIVSGPMFAGNEGKTVTPRMAEVFQQSLESNYAYQTALLSSPGAILLETFDVLMEPAKAAARIFNELSDEDETGQRTAALPADLQGPQIAPDGFLGPEVRTNVDEAYIASARDRFFGRFAGMCALPSVIESGMACPVDHKGCEGTGCVSRGPIRALETVQLFVAPGDSRVVTTLDIGDWGFNELERTWFAPCKSIVTEASGDDGSVPPVSTTLWRLREAGEGYSKFLWPGNGIVDYIGTYTESRSGAPSQNLDPCFDGNRESWSLMTTAEGTRGWYTPRRQFAGSNSIDVAEPLRDIPQWLVDYPEEQDDVSGTEDPFLLVLQRPSGDVLAADLQGPQTVPDGTSNQVVSGTGWSESVGLTNLEIGVQASDTLVSSDNGVTVFGREVLTPMRSGSPPYASVVTGRNGTYRAVFQTMNGTPLGWEERMALVPRDPGKKTFAISPNDVFRFSRAVAWSDDGRFALVQYNFDEFASDGLLVELASGATARIKSDRQDVLHSIIDLASLRDLDGGVHSVNFGHLKCPTSDPNCGMATVEDAGTTTVKFRVPDAPAQSPTSNASQVAMFDALPNGIYGSDAAMCARKDENFGDAYYRHFRQLDRPDLGDRYDQACSIVSRSESEGAVKIDLGCNAEGSLYEDSVRWQILSPTRFTDLDANGGPRDFQLCEALPAPAEPTGSEWTEAIAIELDSIPFDCFQLPSTACLRAAGAPEETVAFVEARETVGGSGAVIPVGFKELGAVDIAYLRFPNAAGTIYPYLVNTAPDLIILPTYPDWQLKTYAERGDRTAQAILRQYPEASAWRPEILGMRMLQSGHQRFSLVLPYTEFCRACPYIAYAVNIVDYDQNGKFRSFETRGLLDARSIKQKWNTQFTASDAQRMPSLVQYFLNIRGYDAGPMDGALGPRSRKAISDFQRENGINYGSGQLDQATMAALVDRETMFSNGVNRPLASSRPIEATASCSSPDSLLSKEEIISTLAGKKADTRPGGNRYVLQSFSDYDWSRDLGTVTLADDRGSFDQAYVVSDGEICTQNLSGGPSYCEQVRRCDYDGSGPKIGFFDGDLVSTYFGEIFRSGESQADSSNAGLHTAPDGYKWLQLASRPDVQASRAFVSEVFRAGGGARIFQANNGWFAITAKSPDPMFVGPEEEMLTSMRSIAWIPDDAFFVTGETYVKELPIMDGETITPAFTRTLTNRNSPTLSFDTFRGEWIQGQVISAGEPVVVWNSPNLDTGNCLISGHEGVWLTCAHTVAFADVDAAKAETHASDQEETPAALLARINGDVLADKLIAATIWENSSVERALLQELATISGADYRRLGDLEKLSRLTAILGLIERRAGVPAGSFEQLNRARNAFAGPHLSRDEVLRDNRWSLNEKKDFHVINIADPSRVEKYTREDGAEAVFYDDPNSGWMILADGVNDATYNFIPDVPLLSSGYVNDNYQHLVLDIVPWVIWGATAGDTTSISERLMLFENSSQYKNYAQKGLPLLAGKLPDGDPVTTNDASQKVDIRTASAAELAALLRAFGVTAENVSFVGGDVASQTRDMERFIAAYQTDPPVVVTPDLPISAGYDSANGVLSACMARDVLFPTDILIGGESFGASRAASIVIAPSDPITGLGALPALCSVDMNKITQMEAIHGRGELERFGLTNPRGLFVRFRMTPAEAREFLSALKDGGARVGVDCEMKTMIMKPYTAVPYSYERIGTCVPKSMTLRAYDFETGDQKFMQFSAGGTVYQPTSGVVRSITPEPASAPLETEISQTRAVWSFEVDGTGEAVVRDIVEGLEGTVAEIVLGYENAYPFQTAPEKKLAVRVFQALPENEVATRAGTERGYGSFVIKSWSDLNNHYYIDDPSSGIANAVVGTIDDIRILSVRELAASSCEWSVSYRIWLGDMTPFGTALTASSVSDGLTFEACFRTTRWGYDVESYKYVDPS